MKRAVATVVLLLLATHSAAAAPWLQFGHDAARTGAAQDAGPAAAEVAFTLKFDDGVGSPTAIVVLGRELFLARKIFSGISFVGSVLYAIDLDTAGVSERWALDSFVDQIASDGARLFVATDEDVQAYPPEGGDMLWRTPLPRVVPGDLSVKNRCVEPALRDGVLYLGCAQWPPENSGIDRWPYVLAVDAADGTILWRWEAKDEPPSICVECDPPGVPPKRGGQHTNHIPWLALVGDTVVVVGTDASVFATRGPDFLIETRQPIGAEPVIWGLDRSDGQVRWIHDEGIRPVASADPANAEGEAVRQAASCGANIAGGANQVLLRIGATLYVVDAATGNIDWSLLLDGRRSGTDYECGGGGVAYAAGSIYVTSFSTVYRIDAATRTAAWQRTFDLEGENTYGAYGLSVAGGHVFVANSNGLVSALRVEDGGPMWRVPMPAAPYPRHYYQGVGEGVLVVTEDRGDVLVVGRTGASIHPVVTVDTAQPALGVPVTADLSRTGAGAFGPATEYRAEWGDGSATEWQASPIMEHAYRQPGVVTATFWARNEAGQTASKTIAFDVGATPQTFLQYQFSAEQQERTFFLLGLLLTLLFAAIGATRLQRKRRLFARESRLVEEAKHAHHGARLDEALDDARQRARMYSATGRLTEAQVALLLQHAGDARRSHRMDVLARDFGDLPHRLYRALQDILADATVSAWEHERLREQLAKAGIPAPVRKRVEKQVDAWAAEDAS